MTKSGVIAELQNLINADDIPCYYKGGIEKAIETIAMDLFEVSEDCISRKWLEENAKELGDYYENTVWAVPLSILEDAPTIEPSRPRGECPYFIDGKWCNLVGKDMIDTNLSENPTD